LSGSFELLTKGDKSQAASVELDNYETKEVIPDLDDLLAKSTEEQTYTELPSLHLGACQSSDPKPGSPCV